MFVKYEDNVTIWNSIKEISKIKNNLYVYGYRYVAKLQRGNTDIKTFAALSLQKY